MKRIVSTTGVVIVLSVFGWLAVRLLSPVVVFRRGETPLPPIPALHAKPKTGQIYPANSQALNQAGGQQRGDTLPARQPHGNVFSSKGSLRQPQGNYAPDALAQLKTLEEVLQSKNDNDPRLDRDFNDLLPEANPTSAVSP